MKTIDIATFTSDIVFCKIYGKNQVWEKRNTWSFIGNPRNCHGFMYICCDDVTVTDKNGNVKRFYKDEMIYIPKDFEYHIFFNGSDKSKICDTVINFQMFSIDGEEVCFSKEIFKVFQKTPPIICSIMDKIAYTYLNMHFPHLTISKLFYELLEKINLYFSHPVITEKSESPVSFAVLYLDNHIGDNIPISALAQKCMMSVSAFRKAFREYTGMSPVEYRMHTKIEKAKQLLSEADMPTVKEVALSLGYDDETYFFRVFYKFTGMTPLEYSGRKNKSSL